MILSEGGIAIYTKKFFNTVTVPDQLIAGYLHALDTLGFNVLSESWKVDSIMFQEKSSLLVREVKINQFKCKFCYLYKGVSYLAPYRLDAFINTIFLNEKLKIEISNDLKNNKIMLSTNEFEILLLRSFFE